MSAPEYGPDDTWPAHDKKHWSEPLAAARAARWTLTYINAPHRFGVVRCPARQHSFDIDKTARGSETKAKEAMKKIAWCTHPAGQVGLQQDRSLNLLDTAELLTAEVAEGLAAAEAKQDAQDALVRLEIQLDTAESSVLALLAEQDRALEEAIAVDDAPDPPVLAGKLTEAAAAVGTSESLAKSVRNEHPGVARPLLYRATTLRARIDQLRGRLSALQERRLPDVG